MIIEKKFNFNSVKFGKMKARKISLIRNKKGMEMVQVAILVAIAVAVGLIFKGSILDFVNSIFGNLNAANF